MRVQSADINNKKITINFKSIRTDRNTISTLSKGTKPILANKKANIMQSLSSLRNNPTAGNMQFILDVADNIKYGQGGDSEFKRILDKDSVTEGMRENTDWMAILADTFEKMISGSKEDTEELQKSAERIFKGQKALSENQKRMLEIRGEITSIITDPEKNTNGNLIDTARFRQNMDYFISSSEIPEEERKICLEKLLTIINGDYKINPQLEDRRFQTADEILNDIIIKRPDEDELTIKDVSQMNSGICAAISICRKAIAYEDKTRYMEMIMDELSDSDKMEVYDITKLGTGEKVKVPKTNIDFEAGIERGYRIIDISAHNWMQNAQSVGDGTVLTGRYEVFDDDNYGVNHDSNWYLGVDTEKMPEKLALQALIKEKEYLDSLLAKRKKRDLYKRDYQTVKAQTGQIQSRIFAKIKSVISSQLTTRSEKEINSTALELIKFWSGKKGNTNELNISPKMSNETKQAVISDFFKDRFAGENIDENALKEIISYLSLYKSYDDELKNIASVNTKPAKYRYYENLYHLAAAHRNAVEANINCDDILLLLKYQKYAKLAATDIQVVNYLSSLQNGDKDNGQLTQDIITIDSKIPYQLNELTKNLLGYSIPELMTDLYEERKLSVEKGDETEIYNIASLFDVKPDKTEVLNHAQKRIDKLKNNSNYQDWQEAARDLGYNNILQLVGLTFSAFVKNMSEGIAEETYNELLMRFGNDANITSAVNSAGEQIEKLQGEYNEIMERWSVPAEGEFILTKLEQTGFIMSRKNLDTVKDGFKAIDRALLENKKIENINERRKANESVYVYSPEVMEILNKIEKAVPSMKKYCKSEYNDLNAYLKPVLDKQYSYIGKLKGEYWVREEGSTGLGATEQLRIIEQMTGKPHYIEYDAKRAGKVIKEGNGGGILSSSVDDTDFAFHAQYIPEITTETFRNPLTGETTQEDVLWTDNTWGRKEKEYFWNGRNGFLYTDYGSGYGWKNGFIVNKDMKIGLPLKELVGATGEVRRGKNSEKFGLVTDIILPGKPKDAYIKLYKMFSRIYTAKDGEKDYRKLERLLKSGYKLDIDYLTSLDNKAERTTERIRKRLKEEIKTKEDFDRLPDDDELKFYMNLMSLYLTTDDIEKTERILDVDTPLKLTRVRNSIIQDSVDEIGAILAKTDVTLDYIAEKIEDDFSKLFNDITEKYGIKPDDYDSGELLGKILFDKDSLSNYSGKISELEPMLLANLNKSAKEYFKDNDSACSEFIAGMKKLIYSAVRYITIDGLDDEFLEKNPFKDYLISSVDKYFNPSSDEELLNILKTLQQMDYETANKFIDLLTPEDIGLNFPSPYEIVRQYQGENSKVSDALWDVVANNVIYTGLNNYKNTSAKTSKAANDYFRQLYVRLTELDIQKHLKQFESQYFNKFKIRQAFPNPVILFDNDIADSAKSALKTMEAHYDSIKADDYYSDIFSQIDEFREKYSKSGIYKKLTNYQDIQITPENADEFQAFADELSEINTILEKDEALKLFSNLLIPLYEAIADSENNNGIIDGKTAGEAFNKFNSSIDEWMNVSQTSFKSMKEEELKQVEKDILYIVNTNVQPRYRNDAIKSLKNYLKLLINEADEEVLSEARNQFTDFYVERHISKTPVDILKQCIKLISEGKTNEAEYKILRSYLIASLNIGYLTGIQFKLVENQGEGINSKMRDMLPKIPPVTSDGKFYGINTNVGLVYLVNQLASENDNYETLKIFLNQSGLSKQALIAVINNFNIPKAVEMIEDDSKFAKTEMNYVKQLISFIREFNEKNQIKFANLGDGLKQLNEYVARRSANIKDTEVFKKYSDYINAMMKSSAKILSSDAILEGTMTSVNKDAISYILDGVNSRMSSINEMLSLMSEKNALIQSIDVPSDSEESKKRDEFEELYKNTQSHINGVVSELNEFVRNFDMSL